VIEPDYTAYRFWFDVAQFAGLCILGVYTWWGNRAKVTSRRFKKYDDRLNKLEQRAEAGPTPEQYRSLKDTMGELHGDLREFKGKFEGINRAVDLINEFLINQGGKN
jgi:hypothetical protein